MSPIQPLNRPVVKVRTQLTTVPSIALALVQVVRERTEDKVQVLYGPSTQQPEESVIVVGLGDENTVVGFETNQTRQQGLNRRAQETFTLHCWLSVRLGDDDDDAVQHAVEAATALLDQIAEALEDNRLRVLADTLDLGPSISWLPVQNAQGAACGISFDIAGTAMLAART